MEILFVEIYHAFKDDGDYFVYQLSFGVLGYQKYGAVYDVLIFKYSNRRHFTTD